MARQVKTSAEVLESITPPAPVVAPEPEPPVVAETPSPVEPEPVKTEATPEPPAPAPEPIAEVKTADLGKPTWVFQINHIQNITFPDNSEYKATFGTHAITDPVLARKLTAYATQPGTKRQIFLLSSPN
jgi:hypothetical protein